MLRPQVQSRHTRATFKIDIQRQRKKKKNIESPPFTKKLISNHDPINSINESRPITVHRLIKRQRAIRDVPGRANNSTIERQTRCCNQDTRTIKGGVANRRETGFAAQTPQPRCPN